MHGDLGFEGVALGHEGPVHEPLKAALSGMEAVLVSANISPNPRLAEVEEAAAMGLPVIASDVVGCRDAVAPGETGVLIPARDAKALERELLGYLRDGQRRAAHGEAGRARVLRDFLSEGIWRELAGEYARLVAAAEGQ